MGQALAKYCVCGGLNSMERYDCKLLYMYRNGNPPSNDLVRTSWHQLRASGYGLTKVTTFQPPEFVYYIERNHP